MDENQEDPEDAKALEEFEKMTKAIEEAEKVRLCEEQSHKLRRRVLDNGVQCRLTSLVTIAFSSLTPF